PLPSPRGHRFTGPSVTGVVAPRTHTSNDTANATEVSPTAVRSARLTPSFGFSAVATAPTTTASNTQPAPATTTCHAAARRLTRASPRPGSRCRHPLTRRAPQNRHEWTRDSPRHHRARSAMRWKTVTARQRTTRSLREEAADEHDHRADQ